MDCPYNDRIIYKRSLELVWVVQEGSCQVQTDMITTEDKDWIEFNVSHKNGGYAAGFNEGIPTSSSPIWKSPRKTSELQWK